MRELGYGGSEGRELYISSATSTQELFFFINKIDNNTFIMFGIILSLSLSKLGVNATLFL